VNALQLAQILGDDRRAAPSELMGRYRCELADFHPERPIQNALFHGGSALAFVA